MKKVLISLLALTYIIACEAQNENSTFTSRFEALIQRMVEENYRPYDIAWDMQAQNLPDSLLPLLKKYEKIPNSNAQTQIYKCYYRYAAASTDTVFIQQMMRNLFNACSRTDSIELSYACDYATEFFKKFDNDLFDKEMIDTINSRAAHNKRAATDYAYISGKLNQKQMIPAFEQQLAVETNPHSKYEWNKVLARLGFAPSIETVRGFMQELSINERLIRYSNVFFYTRQKLIIDLLLQDLNSKAIEEPTLEFGEPPRDGWPYAGRAMRLLMKLVKDFPIKEQKIDYATTTDEMLRAIENNDLAIARKWAKQHKNDYKIIAE
ncbi:hypothetical protein AGMMS4957_05330 [Bacteroidia bacterium]|nr:hypothetical protein AGMMS4957_05330 [Bacteroidia bacterium]